MAGCVLRWGHFYRIFYDHNLKGVGGIVHSEVPSMWADWKRVGIVLECKK